MTRILGFALLVALTCQSVDAAPACEASKAKLSRFLGSLPHGCAKNSDCTGRYARGEGCFPAVVANKKAWTSKTSERIAELQSKISESCPPRHERGPCAPIPFEAACVSGLCLDTKLSAP